MANEKFLNALPKDIADKIREAESRDDFKQASAMWTDINDTALSSTVTVAAVAWCMAANEREREMVVQHTAIAMTVIRQIQIVCEAMIPVEPRIKIINAVVRGISEETQHHDAWLRKYLPQAVAERAAVLAAGGPFADGEEPKEEQSKS